MTRSGAGGDESQAASPRHFTAWSLSCRTIAKCERQLGAVTFLEKTLEDRLDQFCHRVEDYSHSSEQLRELKSSEEE